MARRDQVLYRDENDKVIGGVCSGLGHYFDIDTTLVRVAFVALSMVGGGGILAYLILRLVLDPAPDGYWDEITEVGETEIVDVREEEPPEDPADPADTEDPADASS